MKDLVTAANERAELVSDGAFYYGNLTREEWVDIFSRELVLFAR